MEDWTPLTLPSLPADISVLAKCVSSLKLTHLATLHQKLKLVLSRQRQSAASGAH